jgi:DNA processing protein
LNEPSISIVGTRRPTLYGTQMAERLGREIAARGVVVVSGMAQGMDAIAHQGAMVVHGRAIGVLGTGVNEGGTAGGRAAGGFAEFVGEEDLRIVKFR